MALLISFFLASLLYSSVGHGGASAYIAILALFGKSGDEISTLALLLNLAVAGQAAFYFHKAGNFKFSLLLPWLAGSVPASFLGGLTHVSPKLFSGLLAMALLFAAFRLFLNPSLQAKEKQTPYYPFFACAGGALIGFLSGIVGVGGGIFLSPLLLLLGLADAKTTASVSSVFIVANSLSGLFGRWSRGVAVPDIIFLVLPAVLAGGFFGSRMGAKKFSPVLLNRLLAVVLLVAALKLIQKFILA